MPPFTIQNIPPVERPAALATKGGAGRIADRFATLKTEPLPRRAPAKTFRTVTRPTRPRLGEVLLQMGAISGADLAQALIQQRDLSVRLGDVLLRHGLLTDEVLADALARQRGIGRAGPPPVADPATDALARQMTPHMALQYRALPWKRVGSVTLIATARPEAIDDLIRILPPEMGPCLFAVVTDAALDARLADLHGERLARGAECQVPRDLSCRLWHGQAATVLAIVVLAMAGVAASQWPSEALRLATAAALLVMSSNLGLRFAGLIAMRRTPGAFSSVRPADITARKLPSIAILVPLHREPDIAAPLTERLSRLDYPRELLDICLVVEADDSATRTALANSTLPGWMRVIVVPDGQPRTKPRAMNYALNFARGDIVGIYDAEDAPARDQLMTVATRFQSAPQDIACLQGLLDYYNPTRNWMSRCFTIEYANWFRLILPGFARLGLAVPLGGTTLFFRRAALERVGGWDAHNVTEDADLGVRLARMGYRTEIIRTTTLEEANAHPIAWIKQRSRWMKGYMLTWAVHARRPVRLWRDLGPRRWLGFHLLFMGAVLNALLMPFLWTTVVVPFGIAHPITDWLPGDGRLALFVILAGSTLLSMAIGCVGCDAAHHRHLRRWVPTMELYYPLATFAVLKALAEIVVNPFHWDKTQHGGFGGAEQGGIATLASRVKQADTPGPAPAIAADS